ncbi:aldehyde dehydrogenase 3, member A2 [Tieghemiomyces parasiticus]|uniref:Aldehyde dehydrogenase n=1 Tax=Tieghemiomyces parasiticus TaxID=78921 RepID=A0A9W8AIL2_9FUNG|nr:aldehyde dehydrogenase 3, member A2 [Tieghemiomyces parasiticus]
MPKTELNIPYSTVEEIRTTVEHLRAQAQAQTQRLSLAKRREQLLALYRLTDENQEAIDDALRADFGRCSEDNNLCETMAVLRETALAINRLETWCKPEPIPAELPYKTVEMELRRDPLGLVLIIGPWNYPFRLVLKPLVGALAAGNTVVLKPSELATHTATLIQRLVTKYLDPDVCRVVQGGPSETTQLLEYRFDHIFFTGSPRVGQIVAAAAARYLTTTTLELGGKSPCCVLDDADLPIALRRLYWGKNLNAGQTCLAPDYLLCTPVAHDGIIATLRQVQDEFYPDGPRESPAFSRVLNVTQFRRLRALVEDALQAGAEVVVGGGLADWDEADLYIPPTCLTKVDPACRLMQEEIFGPILPIVTVTDPDAMITFINDREHPLALYVFSTDRRRADHIIARTSAGSVCVNDTMLPTEGLYIPFGGVGQSGMGSYNGRHTFHTFSHAKPVLRNPLSFLPNLVWSARYPPYGHGVAPWKARVLNFLLAPEKPRGSNRGRSFVAANVAVLAGILAYFFF